MKKQVLLILVIVLIVISAFVFTSCKTAGPDISFPSVHYLTDTKVNFYWDYQARAQPFNVFIKESTQQEYTQIATDLQTPPCSKIVESGKTYDWKVETANGSTGGPWSFTVP